MTRDVETASGGYLDMGILVTSIGHDCISLAIRISEVTTWGTHNAVWQFCTAVAFKHSLT